MSFSWAASLVLLSIVPAGLAGQNDGTHVWGSLGLGLGGWTGMEEQHARAGIMYALELAGRRGPHVLVARAGGSFAPVAGGVSDFGMLYGRAWAQEKMHLWAGAGIAYVEWLDDGFLFEEDVRKSTVGVPVVAELALVPTGFLGVDLKAFGNINTVSSYGGLAVAARLGAVRSRTRAAALAPSAGR